MALCEITARFIQIMYTFYLREKANVPEAVIVFFDKCHT